MDKKTEKKGQLDRRYGFLLGGIFSDEENTRGKVVRAASHTT